MQKAKAAHAKNADIGKQWMDSVIKPDQAIIEIEPVLVEITGIVKDAEGALGKKYGFGAGSTRMGAARRDESAALFGAAVVRLG